MERLVRAKEYLTSSYGIQFGIPTLPLDQAYQYRNDPFEELIPPMEPHVFLVRSLDLRTYRDEFKKVQDVLVMFAHGDSVLTPQGEDFRFVGTGKPVHETTQAYQDFAKQGIVPPLDFVIACRGRVPAKKNDDGSMVIHPSKPMYIVSADSFPQVYPGSLVEIGAQWRRGRNGLDWMHANATEWQGIERWEQYWHEQG